jgi:hypothetical protein
MRAALSALVAVLAASGCGAGGVSGGPDAAPGDCHGFLDAHGVGFTVGPDMPGVADPVTIDTPVLGIVHRVEGAADPRDGFFMDCQLARALVRAAPLLAERDVVEVDDLGVYNYRCIGGGPPPDCPNGISQHAFALAIDVAGYLTSDGTYYRVLDDFVIDPDGEDTCTAATDNPKDQFLHEIVCAQKAAGIWNIALTPNYNADHRNHFHLDLTEGSDFIERRTTPAVDVGPDRH